MQAFDGQDNQVMYDPSVSSSSSSKFKFIIIGGVGLVVVLTIILLIATSIKKPNKTTTSANSTNSGNTSSTGEFSSGGSVTTHISPAVKVGTVFSDAKQQKEFEVLVDQARVSNVTVTEDEVNQMLQQQNKTSDVPDFIRNSAKEEILKNKLIPYVIDSRTAYVIGAWIPAYNYDVKVTDDQKKQYALQRQQIDPALADIAAGLQAGRDAISIVKEVNQKYPALASVMSINGFGIDEDVSAISQPKSYLSADLQQDLPAMKALQTMNEGEIKVIKNEYGPGSGGRVIKLIKVTKSAYKTYADWLAAQK